MAWTRAAVLTPRRQANAERLLAGIAGGPARGRTIAGGAFAPITFGPYAVSVRGRGTPGRNSGLTRHLPHNPCRKGRTIVTAAFTRLVGRSGNSRAGHAVRILAGTGRARSVVLTVVICKLRMRGPLRNGDSPGEAYALRLRQRGIAHQ
jgi:hypothetical protein